MEHLHPTTFPESLKDTLHCYQLTSIDSLSGPSGYPALAAQMWFKENKQLPPVPPQPMVQIPYFIPNDKSAKRSDTMLAGEKIACFIVGGEKRLCLPQILTSVLREYSIAEINQACAELHIYCSRCLPDQLEILKVLGILPINTAQCGLITKTDAERLVALLTDQHEPVKKDRLPKDIDTDSGISVYHECFGRAYGKLYPGAYVSPVAKCIKCEDCRCMYSPQRFISHSDRSFEKRTCHWGFDPENWRNYLLLPLDVEGAKREEYQKILDEIKDKFDPSVPSLAQIRYNVSPPTPSKRRYDSEQESPSRKKIKEEDGKVFEPGFLPHPYASIPYGVPGIMRHSAFRPWSPGLSSLTGHTSSDVRHELRLNGMMPFPVDRAGPFPQYLQTSRPLVLASRASDFSIPQPTDARVSSSIRLPHPHERKQSSDLERSDSKSSLKSPLRESANEKDKNNNHRDQMLSPSASLPKVDLTRTRSFEKPIERHGNRSLSPSPRSSNVAEISPRGRPQISPAPYPSSSQPSQSTNAQINNIPELEIARPISRSREAAATAMLELKTSGQYRSGPPPLLSRPISPPVSTHASEPPRKLPSTPGAQKTSQTLISLNRHHYKWIIGGQNYIVSAAGVQSLEMLRHLVEAECGNESGRDRLMHEIVKMKSLHEEKLDIMMRVRRDLESQLELLKASNCETQQQATESRRLFREEIEKMRQEHARMTEELGKMVKNGNPNQGSIREDESGTEKKMQDLQSLVLDLRMKNEKLKLDLIDEKEKKQEAAAKLEDYEFKRGRMPFLMDSPLSRMVRGVGNIGRKIAADEEHKSPSSPRASPNVKKSLSTQVPHLLASAATSISHCQPNGISPPTTASINGLPREQLISNDIEAPKTVVVS